jgi:hypothetical protein
MTLPKNSRKQQPEFVDPLTEREMEILRLLADGWIHTTKLALFSALGFVRFVGKSIPCCSGSGCCPMCMM